MSKEILNGEVVKSDIVDVGIGVGAFLGLFIAGTEFVKITDAQSINAVQFFATRIIALIGVAIGTTAAVETLSRLRHKKS